MFILNSRKAKGRLPGCAYDVSAVRPEIFAERTGHADNEGTI
jgi:hypothetical protein